MKDVPRNDLGGRRHARGDRTRNCGTRDAAANDAPKLVALLRIEIRNAVTCVDRAVRIRQSSKIADA
jgi:hypothetical protein